MFGLLSAADATVLVAVVAIVPAILAWYSTYHNVRKTRQEVRQVRDEVKSANGAPTGEHVVRASEKADAMFDLLVGLDSKVEKYQDEVRQSLAEVRADHHHLRAEVSRMREQGCALGAPRARSKGTTTP